ncbi:MAG TPA: D-alanyl-D-alanine carboxypeptidase family protein, partial [Chloroflexota bacterium]
LGTAVTVADARSSEEASTDYASSRAGAWLLAHAWEYGYVPAPAETPAGEGAGYEPWTLRWVGREMAARLRERTGGDPTRVAAELAALAGGLTSTRQ